MSNHRKHYGVIRPTIPNPVVFWGSVQEIADYLKITRRSATSILNGSTGSSKLGFRRMTEQEQITYYEPPKPPKTIPTTRKNTYNSKLNWKITFLKNWNKGEKYPTDSKLKFSGTPQEFTRLVNCNTGLIYRMINTHIGNPEKYPLRSVKGWSIARIRKYDTVKVK